MATLPLLCCIHLQRTPGVAIDFSVLNSTDCTSVPVDPFLEQ